MSHQTGIKANDELKKFFGKCKDGKIRVFKVSIENEQLALMGSKKVSKKWEDDFNAMVPAMIEENEPCYILYRLDTRHSSGYNWLLISWCPDTAPVRQKMLYASTKSTLKQEFGTGDIHDELHATVKEEMTIKGYMEHKRNLQAPAPLTNREEELKELKTGELAVVAQIGVDTKQQTISGVGFPIDQKVIDAVKDFKAKRVDYLQISIDGTEEKVCLAESSKLHLKDLPAKIPKDCARYHLFNFKHTHEGDYMETNVFIYSIPDVSTAVRERMLFSSNKFALMKSIEAMGVEIGKHTEIDTDDVVNEEFLMNVVHPVAHVHRLKFDKPKGPPNRGAKRITKQQ